MDTTNRTPQASPCPLLETLEHLERTMESLDWQADELQNHSDPAIRAQAQQLTQTLAIKMQALAFRVTA